MTDCAKGPFIEIQKEHSIFIILTNEKLQNVLFSFLCSFRDNGYISARPGSTSTPTTAALVRFYNNFVTFRIPESYSLQFLNFQAHSLLVCDEWICPSYLLGESTSL